MTISILIILFVLAIIFPKSRFLYCVIMSVMWLLFSFNTGAPDTSIYEWIYIDNIPKAFEPLFTAIMAICRFFHLPFVGFRMVVATLILLFLHLALKKIGQYKTLGVAMYIISPFPWQVSGMRAALACAILMYGISTFAENPKRNIKKFCFFMLMATLVHYSSILFAVLLLAIKPLSKKKLLFCSFVALLGTLVLQYSTLLLDLVSQFTDREKIIVWLSAAPGKEGYPNWKGFTAELIVLFGNIIFTTISGKIISRYDFHGYHKGMAEIVCGMNYITILFIPFLRLNDTYSRLLFVMHAVNILLYAMTAYYLQEQKERMNNALNYYFKPKVKISINALAILCWTFATAFYQAYPYLGTSESVLVFLDRNSLLP